jgi:hypothetical protein
MHRGFEAVKDKGRGPGRVTKMKGNKRSELPNWRAQRFPAIELARQTRHRKSSDELLQTATMKFHHIIQDFHGKVES